MEVPEEYSESESEDTGSEESGSEDAEYQGVRRDGHALPQHSHRHHHDKIKVQQNNEPSDLPAHVDDDSDVEKVINYRQHTNPFTDIDIDSETTTPKNHKPPDGKFNSRWWLQHSYTHRWEKRNPFIPCNHEGSCDQAKCRCYKDNVTCEKTCRCSQSCNRRFPGCDCVEIPDKHACTQATCLCMKFRRECDADLCRTCGATEILDPVNRYNEDALKGRCFNVGIQRGVPKKTLLGHSGVHGFGLYAGEDINKDEYVGEYTGELISVKESDRRSTIYECQQTMYLFKLNMSKLSRS